MSRKGWNRRSEYSWRHDGYALNNKLNVFVNDDLFNKHASDHNGSSYVVVYSVNNSETGPPGNHILYTLGTKEDARKKAVEIMEDNPDSLPEEVSS